MNIEQQKINCPHCKQRLVIEDQILNAEGCELLCPTCGKSFILSGESNNHTSESEEKKSSRISFRKCSVPDVENKKSVVSPSCSPSDIPPSQAEESNHRRADIPPSSPPFSPAVNSPKRYRFCRWFIFASRIIAVLLPLISIVYFYFVHQDYVKKRADVVKKYLPSLTEQQEKFSRSYMRVARLLLTANNTQTGMRFPDNIQSVESTFNSELMTSDDVKESLNTMSEYNNKLSVIDETMKNYFTSPFDRLFHRLSRGDAVKISVGRRSSSTIKVTTGLDAKFYSDDPTALLSILSRNVQTLKDMLNRKNISDGDVEVIKSGLTFIEKYLNSQSTQRNILSQQQAVSTKNVTIGDEQFKDEKTLLTKIFKDILKLCSKDEKIEFNREKIYTYVGIISSEYKSLHNNLCKYSWALERVENDYRLGIKVVLESLCYFIVAAFLILVVADYLDVHLDMACTLQKILSKYSILFCFVIPIIISGCGKSLEDKLQAQRPQLEAVVINQILAEQIKQNPNATIFVVPGKSLYMISGGIPEHTPFSKPYEIVSFYRAYNAVKLNYTSQVKFGKIIKSKSKSSKYSHKAVMTASLVRTLYKDPAANTVRGVEIHGVPPELPTSYESWKKAKIANIVPDTHDLAAVVYRLDKLPPESQETEYRTVSVGLNKKNGSWEVENAGSMPAYVAPPKMPEFYKFKDFQAQHGFKHLTCRETAKNLYFSDSEWESADMILNEKRMKYMGKVKPVIVVKHTLALAEYMSTWERNFTFEMWIKTMENVSKFSQAEDLSLVAKYLEEYGRYHFFKPLTFTAEGMEQLLDIYKLLKNNTAVRKLNNGQVISICADIIKREVLLTKNTINYIMAGVSSVSGDNLRQCERLTGSDKFLKHDKNLSNHIQTLSVLCQLQESRYIPNSYRQYNDISGYDVFVSCRTCYSTGLYICTECRNTRRCSTCGGKGASQTIKFYEGDVRYQKSGPTELMMKRCFRCYGRGICSLCKGRKYRCSACDGAKKIINAKAVAIGVQKEKKFIIDKLSENHNKIIKTFNVN